LTSFFLVLLATGLSFLQDEQPKSIAFEEKDDISVSSGPEKSEFLALMGRLSRKAG